MGCTSDALILLGVPPLTFLFIEHAPSTSSAVFPLTRRLYFLSQEGLYTLSQEGLGLVLGGRSIRGLLPSCTALQERHPPQFCCTYRYAARQQHIVLLCRPLPMPVLSLHLASVSSTPVCVSLALGVCTLQGLVEVIISVTIALAAWVLLLLSAAAATLSQQLLLHLDAFSTATAAALAAPRTQPVDASALQEALFWAAFLALLWLMSVLQQRHTAEIHSRPWRDAAAAAALLLQHKPESWEDLPTDVPILALLGMRQAVSSLQLSVNQAKTRYVQQQSLAPNPKGSATSSSDGAYSGGGYGVFEAVTSLVLRQLRLYSALLRLLPTLCSAEARQVHESALASVQHDAALIDPRYSALQPMLQSTNTTMRSCLHRLLVYRAPVLSAARGCSVLVQQLLENAFAD
ncbi:hypothetical protein cyc_04474 [Cyclospora cayetanensis]|uniref:Uncharacterized protein n=1 Tax=Cyclospora cayetanensis TaxID=88456 RepID=A0A1D3D0A3_9EIME|nr:hypothetical protein cyc_04474 [Cyclospora cayetanensis]